MLKNDKGVRPNIGRQNRNIPNINQMNKLKDRIYHVHSLAEIVRSSLGEF
ncbi:hypothetical protein SMBr_35620 [Shewanella sp. M-Br]|nr:hypothetical protein SMBr_35620 [Shewanella sp. M-Br]